MQNERSDFAKSACKKFTFLPVPVRSYFSYTIGSAQLTLSLRLAPPAFIGFPGGASLFLCACLLVGFPACVSGQHYGQQCYSVEPDCECQNGCENRTGYVQCAHSDTTRASTVRNVTITASTIPPIAIELSERRGLVVPQDCLYSFHALGCS